jgi:hypothetical protein
MSWNQGNYIIKGEEVKVKSKVRRKVVTTCQRKDPQSLQSP